nr:MAG TPA: hypothetical protein [Caudoviricetes sp.]
MKELYHKKIKMLSKYVKRANFLLALFCLYSL